MSPRVLRTVLLGLAFLALAGSGFYCTNNNTDTTAEPAEETPTSAWHNVYDPKATYVGMQACRTCHEGVYETFIKTGMGQSFGLANKEKSAADFSPAHAIVYDSALDYYYKPYWRQDTFYILEYRLEGKDTVHQRQQRVDYVVGSGQHTNSHLLNTNGYLNQAPITFYTQKGRWDMAPGFEKGASSRFSRLIQIECMSCHNAYPGFVANSENKFTQVPAGIDCERCHGPGSLHIADRQNNPPVDTSKTPDYTIVNPLRLSVELQNNVCQRCHLQGIAVLNDGKSFFDFRPGMKLSEVMNVFMPEYEGAKDKMIMASHVERMKKSNCYVISGKMSCINCHDPHISVKFTPRTRYTNACQGCHTGAAGQPACKELLSVRQAKKDDCVACHMPRNSSIDIPHVAVTDHYIRRRPMADTALKKITAFLGMQCFNNGKPGAIATARGFMEFYERYTPSKALLDSALRYLGTAKQTETSQKQNRDYIRAYYLLTDYPNVLSHAAGQQPEKVTDAWTAYRIGEAYYQTNKADSALSWYRRATEIWQFSLDFQNKYGICLLATGKKEAAQKVFQFIVNEYPYHVSAHTNLGYIYMAQGNNSMAFSHLATAQSLDPDYEQNLINLAVWYHTNYDDSKAKYYLEHLLKKHPANERAKAMLLDLLK